MVIDVSFIYLKQFINENQLDKIFECLRGYRIYLPIKEYEYKKELKIYNHAISLGYTHEEALKAVSHNFNKNKKTISRHIQKGLFDEH